MIRHALSRASRQAAAGLAREFSTSRGSAAPQHAACGRRYMGAAAALLAGSVGGVALCLAAEPLQPVPQQQPLVAASTAEPTAEPKEPDLWDRWASIKAYLNGWRRWSVDVPLPADKLKCHLPPGGYSMECYRPVVLVSCGSFNPPTYMHLRMLELAQTALAKEGCDVLGSYMSPVNDAYWKQALAAGRHRVRMCQLATLESDSIMVDSWEVEQRQYTRTLFVLQRVAKELGTLFGAGQAPSPAEPAAGACPSKPPRVIYVCGADVLHSMADPTMWRQDLLETLLSEHGVVCVSRDGSDTAALLDKPGSLLNTYRRNVRLVQEPVPNEISSSRVRHELEQGHSVRYLLPDAVIHYIYGHGLYNTGGPQRPRVLHPGGAGQQELQAHPVPTEPARSSTPHTLHRIRQPVYVFDPTLGILVDACDLATPAYVFEPCSD